MSGRAPDISLEKFPIQVAAWRNVSEEDGRPYYSIKRTKRYKDKDTGEYKDTEYLAPNDLLISSQLELEMWRRISIKDRNVSPQEETSTEPEEGKKAPF